MLVLALALTVFMHQVAFLTGHMSPFIRSDWMFPAIIIASHPSNFECLSHTDDTVS